MTTMENLNESSKSADKWQFTDEDRFLLHTLLAKKEWLEKNAAKPELTDTVKKQEIIKSLDTEKWELSQNIELYDWQKKCLNLWFENNGHGTVKVVTGAGKTILALSIIERLKRESEPDLRVAIVVPTIVLMHQWLNEFKNNTNIPPKLIGFLGGGYEDSLKNKKVIICVINSAQKKLPKIVETTHTGDRLLLIVDECHRAGSDVMCNIFKTPRRYSLGLSATPERESDTDESEDEEEKDLAIPFGEKDLYNEQIVGKELGPIIYELTLNEAYEQGILPSFEIRHYGLQLTPGERNRYETLTKTIRDIKKHLLEDRRSQKYISEREFSAWLKRSGKGEGTLTAEKRQYLLKIRERKHLLYQAIARKAAVLALLKKDLEENPASKILIFHEMIEESTEIWRTLYELDIHAVPENSKFSDPIRYQSIELFREGIANVLVSVKALVEGFNVPSVDTGIIVASSSSIRQRIQTYGRLLRRHRVSGGKEKHSVINILYIANTVDEVIYSKIDWASITGAERNSYYTWDVLESSEPVQQSGPPRIPPATERNIDESSLIPGSVYPGAYEGIEFSADSQGNIFFEGDRNKPIQNPQDIPAKLKMIKNSLGRFKVTPLKLFVIARFPIEDEWTTKFITKLEEPFRYITGDKTLNTFKIDELYPGEENANIFSKNSIELMFKRKGYETLIAKKIKNGEIYARTSNTARDPDAGKQAEELKNALNEAEERLNRRISKFFVNPENIAFVLIEGKTIFISKMNHNLEFPDR